MFRKFIESFRHHPTKTCLRERRTRARAVLSRSLHHEPLEDRRLLAGLVVNSSVDNLTTGDGLVTLREAIIAANNDGTTDLGETGSGADTITFDPSLDGTPIVLTMMGSDEDGSATGDLDITSGITIIGNGPANTFIDAGFDIGTGGIGDRVLDVRPGGDLTVTGVTLTGGDARPEQGGGVRVNSAGVAKLSGVALSGNAAMQGAGAMVLPNGQLTVNESTISGNTTPQVNGAYGGGISSNGNLTVSNSTVSDNTAQFGGGIDVFGGVTTITNSTITNNSSNQGGGLNQFSSILRVANSIIAENTATTIGADVLGTFESLGNNLLGDGDNGIGFSDGIMNDQVGSGSGAGLIDPRLGALASNGGPTFTHALLPGSPATDAGEDSLALDDQGNPLTADQRGENRFVDTVDIGAFEVQVIQETEVTLAGGTLTITDIAGGNSNDDLSISFAAGTYTITSNNGEVLQIAIPGAAGNGTTTVTIPDTSITSIVFNSLGGDDTLTIDHSGAVISQPITFNGGTGSDAISMVGGTFETTTYHFLPAGADGHNGSVVSTGTTSASVTFTGLEPLSNTGTTTDIVFNLPNVANPDVTLRNSANAGETELVGSTFEDTIFVNPTGSLTINHGGVEVDAFFVEGVDDAFDADLTIASDGEDSVRFQTNATDIGTGDLQVDAGRIAVQNVSGITTAGNITLDADTDVQVAGNFTGVRIDAEVTTTGGNIVIEGRGGNDPGDSQIGVFISRTVSAGGTGTVDIIGIGGASTGGGNTGVEVSGGPAIVTSAGGAVSVTGHGGGLGAAFNNPGVFINSASITSGGTGAVTVTGTGATAAGGNNDGVILVFADSGITSVGGDVRVMGVTGTGPDSFGVNAIFNSGLSAGADGRLDIVTDTLNVNSNSQIGGVSSGTQTIDISGLGTVNGMIAGPADLVKTGAGTLNLNGDNTYTGDTLIEGGTLALNNATGNNIHGSPNVELNGGVLDASGLDASIFGLSAGQVLLGNGNVTGSVSASAGSFVRPGFGAGQFGTLTTSLASVFDLGAHLDIQIENAFPGTGHTQLVTNGIILGGDLNLSGTGAGLQPGDEVVVIDNQSALLVGTFDGLPEGAVIPNVLGTGLAATITYEGGDGNDVSLLFGVNVSVDAAGNLVIEDPDGSRNDDITIAIDGINYRITDPINGLAAGSGAIQDGPDSILVPIADVTGEIRVSGRGGDDTITVDNNGGVINRPIVFDGGAQTTATGDTLAVVNDLNVATTQILNYTDVGPDGKNGNIDLDGTLIVYTGLEPIMAGDAANTILNLPVALVNDAMLQNSTNAGEIEIIDNGATFEDTIIPNPTNSLTVNLGDAGDSLTIDALDGAFAATLEVNGGLLADTVDASTSTTGLTINGGAGDDQLTGSSSGDTLVGQAGADTLVGNAGDDIFIWNNGDGSDIVEGGADTDQLTVNGAGVGASNEDFTIEENGAGRGVLQRSNLIPFTLDFDDIEQLDLNMNGASADDELVTVNPLDGTDLQTLDITVGGANSNLIVLNGTSSPDIISIAPNETITGLGPVINTSPTLGSFGDTITINGNGGDDQITVAGAVNVALVLNGNDGNDTINAAANADGVIIDGGGDNDILIGSAGDDQIAGGEGDDTITGNAGADVQLGDAGDDTFVWNNGDGPDDNTGGADTDTFIFNGADGADDGLNLLAGSGDGSLVGAEFNLERTAPSAFTIEGLEIENVNINGLDGDDHITVVPSAILAIAVDGGDSTTPPADRLTVDLASTAGAGLSTTAPGEGEFSFTSAHKDISFSNVETVDSLNGTFVVDAVNTGAGDDDIVLSLDGNDTVVTVGGAEFLRVPSSNITELVVNGQAGNDTFTIDYINGNPIPSEGLFFNGNGENAGGGDTVMLVNGNVNTVHHLFTNENDGMIDVDGSLVTYTGLEPIVDNLNAVDRIFTFNGGDETITVGDDIAAVANVSRIDSTSGESVDFVNPTNSLTVNSGTGDDVINVGLLDANYAASLVVDGGADTNDTLTMTGVDLINIPGRGLTLNELETVTINDGEISGNAATVGGGILINNSTVATTTVNLNGVTIRNNTATGGNAPLEGGGGIYNNGAVLNVNATTMISGNVATTGQGSGGGIFSSGTLTVTGATITGNNANRAGGGIEIASGSGPTTLTDVTLSLNDASAGPGNGGGLHVSGNGNVQIVRGSVAGNTAASEGGGLWNGGGTMAIDGTMITNNTASGNASDNGGGGVFNDAGILDIDDATISGNQADGTSGSGGGVFSLAGTVTIDNSTIQSNSANRAGGGIEIVVGTVTLTSVSLLINDVDGQGTTATTPRPGNGGGLHVSEAATVTLAGGLVQGNVAAAEGGGLWNSDDGTMILDNVTIENNVARAAAGTTDQGGGGVFNNGGDLTIRNNSSVNNNLANESFGNGGGVMTVGGTVTLENITLANNAAARAGGAIENNHGDVTLTNVLVNDNSATVNGGGLHAGGAASVTAVRDGSFAGNTAGQEGGGLWNGGGMMTVSGTAITNNTANSGDGAALDPNSANDQGGGGVFNIGGVLTINTASISDNNAITNRGNGGGVMTVGGNVLIADTTIQNNAAARAGGGIENNDGTVTISNQTVGGTMVAQGNRAGINGGGLHATGANSQTAVNGGLFQNNIAEQEGGGLWNGTGEMTLNGVTIINNTANSENNAANDQGGGGVFNIGGTLNINAGTISTNFAVANLGNGGGVMTVGGIVTLDNTIIGSNQSGRDGGGLLAVGNSNVTVNGGTFQANNTPQEGGGLFNGTGVLSIDGTTITENVALSQANAANDQGGGGIFNDGGNVTIGDATITSNLANVNNGNGGGVMTVGGTITIASTSIQNNTAARAGGGVENSNGNVILTNVTLGGPAITDGNTAGINGGGLHATGLSVTTINDGSVSNNVADQEGGGLWASSIGTMSLSGVIVSFNTANSVNAANDAQGGGGIFNDGGVLAIRNNVTISNNVALDPDGTATNDDGGGGIFNNEGVVSVIGGGTIIRDNAATDGAGNGGGILNIGGELTVDSARLLGNAAARAGGGVENTTGILVLKDSVFGGPVPIDGNTAGVNGGGVHASGQTTNHVEGGTFQNNVAGQEGGGLWNSAGGSMSINGTTIQGNTASGAAGDQGGGGVFNAGGVLNISNANITGNIADGASGSGGGILNDATGSLSVSGSMVTSNRANRAGGGIETTAGTTNTLTNVNLNNNNAGVAPSIAAPGNGGGLHISGDADATITGGSVNGNTAAREGGGLWNGNGTLIVTGATINNNRADGTATDQGGGGVFNDAGIVSLLEVELNGNEADRGGAAFNQGTLNVRNSQIMNNVDSGLHYVNFDGILTGNVVSGNTGGGITGLVGTPGDDVVRITSTTIEINADVLRYDGAVDAISISTGDGEDTIQIRSTSAASPITIDTGIGNDVINIASDAPNNLGSLNSIIGAINVIGGPSTTGDTLNISDASDSMTNIYSLNATTFQRTGASPSGLITFGGIENLQIQTGLSADTINIESTPDNTSVTLQSGPGTDTVSVTTTGTNAGLQIGTGRGDDMVNVATTGQASTLTIDTGEQADTVTINDRGASSVVNVLTGQDNDAITIGDPNNPASSGANPTATLTVDAGSGNDSFNVNEVFAATNVSLFGGADDDSFNVNGNDLRPLSINGESNGNKIRTFTEGFAIGINGERNETQVRNQEVGDKIVLDASTATTDLDFGYQITAAGQGVLSIGALAIVDSSDVETIEVRSGSGDDSLAITSEIAYGIESSRQAIAFDGGPGGNDALTVQGTAMADRITIGELGGDTTEPIEATNVESVTVNGDDGDDLVTNRLAQTATLNGGAGENVLLGGFAIDVLSANSTRNRFFGRLNGEFVPQRGQGELVYDVNGDGLITAIDPLQVINRLNAQERSPSGKPTANSDRGYLTQLDYADVNGDGIVSALDALMIINRLNEMEGLSEPRLGSSTASPWAGSVDDVFGDEDDDDLWGDESTLF